MNLNDIDRLISHLRSGSDLTSDQRNEIAERLEALQSSGQLSQLHNVFEKLSASGIHGEQWEEGIHRIFSILGPAIEADRICFYEVGFGGSGKEGMACTAGWRSSFSDRRPALSKLGPFFSKSGFGDLLFKLEDGKPCQLQVSGLPIGSLKKMLKNEGVQSTLILPIIQKESLAGLVRFDYTGRERLWSDNEISLLQPVLFQVCNLIEKRDLEQYMQNTYRQAQIGTWEMDLDKGTYNWSPITREIFEMEAGEDPSEEMVKSFLFDDEHRKELMKKVERAQITGEPYDLEFPVKTAKGNVKWVRDTGQAEFKNGKCVRLHGIVQDIHKRKLAEFESQKNKQLLEAITQQTDMAVWVRDHLGNIIFVNNQWKSFFGLDSRKVSGKTLFDLFDRKTAGEMVESDRKVVEKNRQVVFEEYIETAFGHRHFMVNKFPLKGIAGLEDAVGGIGTDITIIKETEKRLQEAEEKLREIIEHSTNLFYTHDVSHTFTYLSPQSMDFLGYPPEDAKRRWTEFVTDHPANEYGMRHTQRAIDTGEPQPPFELQLRRGDDEIIWVEVNEAPVVKNGTTVSIAGSLTDITKRKKAQEKIKESLKEKETLLAEIHHRVKNNLAVVASLMQLQAMESTSDELKGQLIESVLRIKSMAGIHEHLYKTEDFSRLDFTHNLTALVNDIINTMQFSARIQLEFACDEVFLSVNQAIPCSLIVNEVITNIIKHGFKGLKEGTIWLELSCSGDGEADEQISLSIKDNGAGFPEDFDPESTNTLGMQLIKTLSGQLLGTYQFESQEKGAAFHLRFKKRADQSLPTG
ncbi:MAG: PAS domain S-box protein [Balneolaceae bacterium]